MNQSYETIHAEDKGEGLTLLTLNRPQVANAMNTQMGRDLLAFFETVNADPLAHRCLVMTGAGDKAFCAGGDLKERLGMTDETWQAQHLLFERAVRAFIACPVPIIGAINGAAITGGFELALNCDFLIASERAVFADTHARVGVLPAWGLTVLLPQRVGFAMARRMSFTGDFVDAATALTAGLVTQVVPHEQLLPTARAVASSIAGNNRAAVLALHDSYGRIEAEVVADGWNVEQETARRWRQGGGLAGLADRVPGVISRGRQQKGSLAAEPQGDPRPPA